MGGDSLAERMASFGDHIDVPTFEQILEMDDGDDEEFSHDIVFGFFEQVETTFKKMDDSLKKKDLTDLSELGHFLKGSSATLGLNYMKTSCEKIQHLGKGMDETGQHSQPDEAQSLGAIADELTQLKLEYMECEKILKNFYEK